MLHIVLVEPEIPQNTGNIARTCAVTGSRLHLVRPLGFDIDEKSVRRAGLDYWQHLDLEVHDSLDEFFATYPDERKWLTTTSGVTLYSKATFADNDMLLFGAETRGLPRELISAYPDQSIRIPMSNATKLRSLNLSNSVAIVTYEALRQLGFPHLT